MSPRAFRGLFETYLLPGNSAVQSRFSVRARGKPGADRPHVTMWCSRGGYGDEMRCRINAEPDAHPATEAGRAVSAASSGKRETIWIDRARSNEAHSVRLSPEPGFGWLRRAGAGASDGRIQKIARTLRGVSA